MTLIAKETNEDTYFYPILLRELGILEDMSLEMFPGGNPPDSHFLSSYFTPQNLQLGATCLPYIDFVATGLLYIRKSRACAPPYLQVLFEFPWCADRSYYDEYTFFYRQVV